MELFIEMDNETLEGVKDLLNQWWKEEDIPTETLKARVVLIYKKGDTSKYENYRPISLLNTIYKIYAGIIQKRLAKTLDGQLSQTQYGFRKDKSTGDAIQLVRRVTEYGQGTYNKLHLVLLDWEKAFDKIDRNKMFEALDRFKVNKKYINIIKSLYKDTQFKVEIEGDSSTWLKQETGIRQGCPLSPYLFIIVMTAMFEDIKEDSNLAYNLIKHRVPGADFDEVMYADDTICISQDTKTMNKFIKSIETIGKEYGLKLNKSKCELITTATNPNIHFADNTKVTEKEEVKYLGCQLNHTGCANKEISKRIINARLTLQKLQTFWRKSNCPTSYKIIALDAVIRSKLIYGTDAMQLNEPELKKMEKFHLQGLRKILKWDTTYINRENTNEKIYEEINKQLSEQTNKINEERKKEGKKKKKANKVIKFSEFYKKMKIKRIEKTINSTEAIHRITFEGNLKPRTPPARRPGRPKYKWAERGIEEYWETIQKAFKHYPLRNYDHNSAEQKDFIKQYASAAKTIPKEEWSKINNTEPKWNKDKTRADPQDPQEDDIEIRLYTDGSCPENKNANNINCPAGWGIAIKTYKKDEENENKSLTTGLFGPVIIKHYDKRFLGAEQGSNNTGELTAICEGLKWLLEQENTETPAAIYYDSKYAAKIATGEYKAESNKYLAAKARTLLRQVMEKRKIRLEHIKGHSNDSGNDAADELANKGALDKECRNQEQWEQIKVTRPEISDKKKHTEQHKANIEQRRASAEKEDIIRITLPKYSYGADRRARFAFGRITSAQARANTMIQRNAQIETTTKALETRELPFEEIEEEENIFFAEEEPNRNDCA